jgi:hypothetical protein
MRIAQGSQSPRILTSFAIGIHIDAALGGELRAQACQALQLTQNGDAAITTQTLTRCCRCLHGLHRNRLRSLRQWLQLRNQCG